MRIAYVYVRPSVRSGERQCTSLEESLDFEDWKLLAFWQRVKRRFSLLRGSYIHPDGTVELASENRS